MKKIDNIRTNQAIRNSKKEAKSMKAEKSLRRRSPAFRAFVISMKVLVILIFVSMITIGILAIRFIKANEPFADEVLEFYYRVSNGVSMTPGSTTSTPGEINGNGTGMGMNLSSKIYYTDAEGDLVEYEVLEASENRTWVSFDKVPQDLKDAFVAIEDQRFYEHNGVDLKRTLGAVINVFAKGNSSYGGSTITQQLVKNLTQDNERTSERKIREIARAIVLERKMTKEQILEMYMNDIYLSQGAYGVQAAAMTYFDKDVSQLTLAECACIAGITQYPTTYDPIINPKNNKKKQLLVLSKMLELNYITQSEYNEAVAEELVFADHKETEEVTHVQSYFTDYLIEQVIEDLSKEFNCSKEMAEVYLYNGGLKIYSTMDFSIQSTMEDYYDNDANFPNLGANEEAQSAMVVIEPSTGHIKGIVGGRGEKVDRGLNRASHSLRQPGSSIKPIAVYAPALEENICNISSYISNSKLTIGSWTPKNSNGKYTAPVKIETAVAYSYNIPAINVLRELGVDKSYDYMKNKLHIDSIVDSVVREGKEYTDKNLSSLALGGLTDGISPLDMTAAYACIANGGMYIEPVSYTKILTQSGELIYEKQPLKERAFSEETAFLMQELLKNVVKYGTASGSVIGSNDTCGKTGTTDNNKDKWFVGFTPSYCAGVWFGFDKPQAISTGTNPSVNIWRTIMQDIHEDVPAQKFKVPDGIEKASICPYTGLYESGHAYVYANKEFLVGRCNGKNHKCIGANKNDYSYTQPDDSSDNNKTKPGNGGDTSDDTSGNQTHGTQTPPTDSTQTETQTPPPEQSAPATPEPAQPLPDAA